jgi:hypothetical protein
VSLARGATDSTTWNALVEDAGIDQLGTTDTTARQVATTRLASAHVAVKRRLATRRPGLWDPSPVARTRRGGART